MSGTVAGVYSVSKEAKLGGLEILQTRHPIAVPEGWSIEKDIKHFSKFWWWEEGTVDYAALMYKSMIFSCGDFEATLDEALVYFYRKDPQTAPLPPNCLSVTDKIDRMEEIVRWSKRDVRYRERLLESLSECRWAESERKRIFRGHQVSGGKRWFYPLNEVLERMHAAAALLAATVHFEHCDCSNS
jgi:hypothetical protein